MMLLVKQQINTLEVAFLQARDPLQLHFSLQRFPTWMFSPLTGTEKTLEAQTRKFVQEIEPY